MKLISKVKKGENVQTKLIALDDVTTDFLRKLPSLRKRYGYTQEKVALLLRTNRRSIIAYEKGEATPTLSVLMKLAELLQTDISESVNYKFFHGKIKPGRILKSIRFYGFSIAEIASLTGYNKHIVTDAVKVKPRASIQCLHAVLELLQKEKEAYAVRQQLIRKG